MYSNWARKKTRSDSQSSCPYYCRKKVSFPGTFWKRCNRHRRPPRRRWGHRGELCLLAGQEGRGGREGRVERLLCVTVVDHDRRRSLKDENGQSVRQTDRQTRHKIHEVDAMPQVERPRPGLSRRLFGTITPNSELNKAN